MNKYALALILLLASAPAFAQGLPPEVLSKEYDNCLQQGGPATPQKQAYCGCMRDKMTTWTEQTYEKIAKEVMADGAKSPTLEAMAKECFAKTSR
jgi:hypothetical protein